MRKRLLSLLLLSICGSMLFAQEPLDIDDVEQVPLGDFTYQWRNICDRTPLHGKCRIILSYRSYTIAHFNKDGILDGLYEKYEDNHLVQKLTYVKGILRGKGYEYYTDGTVKKECVWNEQGKIDRLMIEYNRIGRTEWDYKNGEVDDPCFARHAETPEGRELSARAADDDKVTGHHAIIITENIPGKLPLDEQNLYRMVAGRMLEAFSGDCTKEEADVRIECGGILFEAGYRRTVHAGWKNVHDGTGKEEDTMFPSWGQDEVLPVTDISVRSVETCPVPLFTEASLLSEMERCGLGTPSTRAGVIELLIARRYVERQGCGLLPTPKGLEVYEAVRDKLIADPEMTARWEKDLQEIERGKLDADVFIQKVGKYARQIVEELSAVRFEHPGPPRHRCPKCGMETLTLHRKVARCGDPDCAFLLFRTFNARELTDGEMLCLLEGKKTDFLPFVSRKGKPYEASLKMDENYRIEMTFRDIPVERQPLPAGDPSVMQAADIPVETPHPGQLP